MMINIKGMSFIKTSFIASFILLLFLAASGCGAVSTSGRYDSSEKSDRGSGSKDEKKNEVSGDLESFDLKPYRPDIGVEKKDVIVNSSYPGTDAWYEYTAPPDQEKNKKITGTQDGFRVQVLATDDLDEANKLENELSSLLPNQKTYVNFEPPFYKVKIGDFMQSAEANDFRFRLSQMGFTEAKVVRETVNLFE